MHRPWRLQLHLAFKAFTIVRVCGVEYVRVPSRRAYLGIYIWHRKGRSNGVSLYRSLLSPVLLSCCKNMGNDGARGMGEGLDLL